MTKTAGSIIVKICHRKVIRVQRGNNDSILSAERKGSLATCPNFSGKDLMFKSYGKNIKWSSLILEMISVVFAILFALWVNQIQQNYDNQQKAKDQQLRIQAEVSRNLAVLEPHFVRNDNLLRSAQELIEERKSPQPGNGPQYVTLGYSFNSLENTEWEVAKLTGVIAHMKSDDISSLSNIYLDQALYSDHWSSFTKKFALGSLDINSTKETNEYLGAIQFTNSVSTRLIDRYKRYLELHAVKTDSLGLRPETAH